jgi:hypothetical protein
MHTLEPAPSPGLDDTCLTRPLVLVAVLVIAGHQIRGAAVVRPSHVTPYPEETPQHV